MRHSHVAPCAAASARVFPRALPRLTRVLRRPRRPPAQLSLRAINQSRSAYFAVRLRADCFDTFRVRDMVQTAIYAKARVRCCAAL